MRAVTLTEYGPPEVLTPQDVSQPLPGPDEVLVAVRATALNRADLLQRMGFYPGPPAEHEIPGMEFSGTVVERGSRVTGLAQGDEIMGIVGGGAYAEFLTVHERQTMPVPQSVALADAAAIPEVFITAFDALVVQGGLTSGRTALVHAGASGVGTAAIQICKAIGATVGVTCSGGKTQSCLELGADLAIDYETEDFVDSVRALTGGRGADVILDVVGGDYLARNLEVLKVKGTIVQVGTMGGGEATFPLGALMPKRAKLIGTVLRARPLEEKIAITRRFAEEMLPLFDTGALAPVIDRRYPLDDVADAHRYMESNASVGKIVVDVA